MGATKGAYWSAYWDEHRQAINAKRRRRYRKDAAYREQVLQKGRQYARLRCALTPRRTKEPTQLKERARVRHVLWKGQMVKLLSIQAIAARCGVVQTTIYIWLRQGMLPPTFADEAGRHWFTEDYINKVGEAIDARKGHFGPGTQKPFVQALKRIFGAGWTEYGGATATGENDGSRPQ